MKKSRWIILILAVFAFILIYPQTAEAAYKKGNYKVTSNIPLKLRKGASTSYKILDQMQKGTVVKVTKIKNNWGKCKYKTNTGWICLDYTKKTTEKVNWKNNENNNDNKNGNYKVTSTIPLKLREGPSTSYKILDQLEKGTIVTVTKITDNWGQCTYKTNTGWICMDYTEKTSEAINWKETAYWQEDGDYWYQSGDYWYFHNTERDVTFKSNYMHKAYENIKDKSSDTNFYAVVDNTKCQTYIFKKKNGEWLAYKAMNCCVGAESTPTCKGTYTISSRGYSFSGDNYTCYYYTQFNGNYLFHSVLYKKDTKTILDGTMGKPVSHGCVRLSIDDAKWVYDNLANGTKVLSY